MGKKKKRDIDGFERAAALEHYLKHGRDREVAIVVASAIESLLQNLIRSLLINFPTGNPKTDARINNGLFEGALPPLRSGRVCADFALAFGFFGIQTYWDIHWIQKIRNEFFAHSVLIESSVDQDMVIPKFTLPEVKKLIDELTLWKYDFKDGCEPLKSKNPSNRAKFLMSGLSIISHLSTLKTEKTPKVIRKGKPDLP